MNTRTLLLIIGFFSISSFNFISAQGVSINEDGSNPDASAMLDVQSTTKGLLIPRVSVIEMFQISSPAIGLFVFCTSYNAFYFFNGSMWKEVGSGADEDWDIDGNDMYSMNTGNIGIGAESSIATHRLTIENADGPNALRLIGDGTYGENAKLNFGDGDYVYIHEVSDDMLAIGANNGIGIYSHQDIALQSNYSNVSLYTPQGSVAVFDSPTTPEPSAVLDVSSSSKGMLIPRMSTEQITAISNPADGLQVYNTSEGKIYIFVAMDNAWREVSYGSGAIYFQTFDVCGDILTDTRDGQTYTTVDINGQCWMAANLNYGTMISTGSYQNNNGTVEKYCLNNSTTYCDNLGGLYQWNEMMNYNSTPGGQGICPDDWHVPTDAEWYAMENFLDPSITNPNATGWRGSSAGIKLKNAGSGGSYNWAGGNNGNNESGFKALPSGYRNSSGYSSGTTQLGTFWTSNNAIDREMYYGYGSVYRNTSANTTMGFGVRCLKD